MLKTGGAAIIAAASLLAEQPSYAQQSMPAEIIVTATREATPESQTPVALTAVTGPALLSAGVTDPTTLDELIPNLSINRGINGLQMTIRGVTTSDVSEKGDSAVAFMLDGIVIARATAQEVSFFDLDRVEVLRGPQGTLFGRNTTAGVVNVISQKPQLGGLSGSVDGTYGNYDTRQLTGVLNVPVTDRIAIRAAVNYDYRDNFVTAGQDWDTSLNPFKDNLSGRLSAILDLGAGELLLRTDYSRLGGVPLSVVTTSNFYSGYSLPGVPTPVYVASSPSAAALQTLNSAFAGPLNRADDTWGVTAEFHYALGPVKVSYLGSYRQFDTDELSASVLGFLPFSLLNQYEANQWQLSQELRLSNTAEGRVKIQGGVYYFRENSEFSRYFFDQPGFKQVFGFVTDPQSPAQAQSWAGFGQVTYSLTDWLRLTGGTRYTEDTKSQTMYQLNCATVACAAPGDTRSPDIAKLTDQKTTWRAGLDFDLNAATLLYVTYSTGYKSGGFNDGCVVGTAAGCTSTAAQLYYLPETVASDELGLKARFAGDTVRLNFAAFHYNYDNLQVGQLSANGENFLLTNAAGAKVDGVEAEGAFAPTSADGLDLSLSWLNARYANYDVGGGINWVGRKLDRSPDVEALAGYHHIFALGGAGRLEFGIHTHISDSYLLSSTNLGNVPLQFRVPSYSKTDLQLTYTPLGQRWYVQGFVKNVGNAIVVTYVSGNFLQNVQFADPRTFGVRAGAKF